MTAISDLLGEVARTFDELGIAFCLGGSWASTLHGEPRQTLDIDLIVEMGREQIEPLARALEPRFYVSRDAMQEAVASARAFNIVDPEAGLKVDCFVRGDAAFDREEFARRHVEVVDERTNLRVPVKTPEDSIVRKLLWFRGGGEVSERQWDDVVGLLRVKSADLDATYLQTWAARLGIADLLDRARAEAAR